MPKRGKGEAWFDRAKPLDRAMADYQLKPKSLPEWKELAERLAEKVYGTPGRPRKWTMMMYWELNRDVINVRKWREREVELSDYAICKILCENPKYVKRWPYEPDYLRRRLREAEHLIYVEGFEP